MVLSLNCASESLVDLLIVDLLTPQMILTYNQGEESLPQETGLMRSGYEKGVPWQKDPLGLRQGKRSWLSWLRIHLSSGVPR